MAPSKHVKISEMQKERLLDFMQKHPDFACNRLVGSLGRRRAHELWEVVANILNACGGATKDVHKWKTTWSDWKLKTKSKANSVTLHCKGADSGGGSVTKLTPLEERLLALLGPDLGTEELGAVEADFQSSIEVLENTNSGSETDMGSSQGIVIDNGIKFEFIQEVATTSHELEATPPARAPKRKGSTSSADASQNKRRHMDDTARDSVAEDFMKTVEERKLQMLEGIYGCLAALSEAARTSADTAERRAAAAERMATACEKQAAAAGRRAVASERKAAASEKQADSTERTVAFERQQAAAYEKRADAAERAVVSERKTTAYDKQADAAGRRAVASEVQAAACERQAAACEKQAEADERRSVASERKATAWERQAAALERIASAKEAKYMKR